MQQLLSNRPTNIATPRVAPIMKIENSKTAYGQFDHQYIFIIFNDKIKLMSK